MKQRHGIVTATAVLAGTGLGAWWAARNEDGDPGVPAAAAQLIAEAPVGSQEKAPDASPQEERPPLTAEQAITGHDMASRGPRQPIPFNHRFHATEMQIDCMYCHAGTERSSMGVVPALEVCMGCHRVAGTGLEPIEELRGYWSRNEPVPWEWVTKLPDFVQFSHRAHLRNGVACEECHGQVAEMDRVYRWAPLTMGWCLECHRSQPQEGDVATDYRLVRETPPPSPPEGRQERSLYPLVIDQRYGDFRAPIDCLTCHY